MFAIFLVKIVMFYCRCNPQTSKLLEKLFTDPYNTRHVESVPEGTQMSKILMRMIANDSLPAKIALLKEAAAKRECLIHGNLILQNIVVKDGEIKVNENTYF